MILQETYTLNNGVEIPKIGFGTWLIDNDKVGGIVEQAIATGYRHIDTAQAYENERGVGEGLRNSGIDRDDVFVTTKLAAEIKDFEKAKEAIDGSLQKLQLDHVDLMIIHSPQPWDQFRNGEHFFEGNLAAWRALEEAHKAGKIRAIGVSNFEQVDLDNILDNGSVKPAVNQFLAHVTNTPFALVEHTTKNDVLVEAYSPIGHGEILGNERLQQIADSYGKSVAQLAIRYCLQLDMLPLPKTQTPEHIRSNADVDFEISAEDMETLKNLEPIEDYGESKKFPVYDDKAQSA